MNYKLIIPFLITYLPILYLIVYSLLPGKIRKFPKVNTFWVVILMICLVYLIAEYPWELSFDKFHYINQYFRVLRLMGEYEYRDQGWIIYNYILSKIFGIYVDLFFFVTAFFYVGGYYFFATRMFNKNEVGYFFVMSVGCLGFTNYGVNVIRAGFSLSLLLVCLIYPQKKWLQIILAIIALSIHKSMIIPIAAYIIAKNTKKMEIALVMWGLCLVLSAMNFDLSSLFESVGFVDERIESYADSINSEGGDYKKGFRLDFLIYSIAPILISLYYMFKKGINDKFYTLVLMVYLWANATWLLVIRMSRSDRMAYLSWFLIPVLTLYPVLKYPNMFKYPLRTAIAIMYIFMGVRLYMTLT